MTSRSRWAWISLAAQALLIIWLGPSLVPHRYTFHVRNAASTDLEGVIVALAGKQVSTGRSLPGGIATVHVRSNRGSCLSVEIHRGTGMHATAFEDIEVGRSTTLVIAPDFTVSLAPRVVAGIR